MLVKTRSVALPLYERLQENSISAFLDKGELKPGDEAPAEMISAMKTAPIGIFILSPQFAAKKWPMLELKAFLDRHDQVTSEAASWRGPSSSLKPILIPVFYRLTVAECRYKDVIATYCSTLSDTHVWKRLADGEDTKDQISAALKALTTHTGIENDTDATNEDSFSKKNARMKLVKKIVSHVKEIATDVAFKTGRSPIFQNPIEPARRLATVSNSPPSGLRIHLVICNHTPHPFTFHRAHIVCGTISNAVDVIQPRKTGEMKMTGNIGIGIKMALMFRWSCEQEWVTLYVENTADRNNVSGIEYFWDTWEEPDYYYNKVIGLTSSELAESRANALVMKSFITNDRHAGAACLVRH